ncbi:uncharacterized protein LOC134251512 [Saccostrea cucullata]|uniref:uncharacterized protein LOC134251512 n=1 Tax=Saccostrea cuccullata TaxID=36930 RepID=UPI002ED591D8
MDPRLSAQDLIRCDLCETAIVQMYCEFCHVKLCKPCIGEHIAEEYSKHQIVPFQQRKSTLIYPKCTTHPTKACELQCKECDIPICALCSVSESHKRHSMSNLFEIYNTKRQTIEKDLQDIESIISPTYEEIATGSEIQIENLEREYEKLTTAVKNHGEECHKEIDNIVNKLTTEIKEMKIKHKAILKKHLEEIKQIQSVIEQTLLSLKKVEESNEILVSMAIEYKSKNQEFCNLPPKVLVSLPIFSPKTIDTEQHYKVTIDGALVYSDWERKTINKVKNGQTVEMIRLQDWIHTQLCVTSSGDLLVTMCSDDYFLVSIFPRPRSKVVRYSGSTEKQTIQFAEEGKPLYSGNRNTKYISENRNLDICVADYKAGAVVVVNQAGKLRFRYTGHPSAKKNKPFQPFGITTDSQSQILTADGDNHCIHILDQDRQFLRYIDNCDLKDPFGLCVDKKDNLFVAEWSGKLKKIKYLR